jgi:replicative DNA helicase
MSASQAILAAQATDVRALPANVEAEAAFLGAVLIDNRIMEEMTVPLRPDHFFAAVHGRVFERILALIDRKAVVTPVTLKPYFESDEGLRELGGTAYLARLTGDGQGLLAPRELAQQIYDLALLRELISVGRNLVEGAMDTSETVEPLKQVEQAEAALFSVAEGAQTGNEAQTFGQATRASLEMIEKALLSGGHISGTTTGLTSVNEKIGGLHDSDLIILAGRPGMGKTSLVTNIAFNCADRLRDDLSRGISAKESVGAAVAFFSLEMSADQLATRILAEQSGISSESLRMGRISREISSSFRSPASVWPNCRSLSTIPPAFRSARCARVRAASSGVTTSGSSWSTTSSCFRARGGRTTASTKFPKFRAGSRPWPRNSRFR